MCNSVFIVGTLSVQASSHVPRWRPAARPLPMSACPSCPRRARCPSPPPPPARTAPTWENLGPAAGTGPGRGRGPPRRPAAGAAAAAPSSSMECVKVKISLAIPTRQSVNPVISVHFFKYFSDTFKHEHNLPFSQGRGGGCYSYADCRLDLLVRCLMHFYILMPPPRAPSRLLHRHQGDGGRGGCVPLCRHLHRQPPRVLHRRQGDGGWHHTVIRHGNANV